MTAKPSNMPATMSRFDRASLQWLADWLAVGVALALPWSTSLAGILIVAWLLAVLPTLDMAAIKRELVTPAGGLPVLLWCLGLIGMLWADVDWVARYEGLDGFNRLLIIPLLLAQFRRSENGIRVICGFLVSETAVLIVSYILILTPGLTWRGNVGGVPVHDDIYQGSAFLVCAFGILGYAAYRSGKNPGTALGFLVLAALFIANFAFVVVSRIALLAAPVLILFMGWRLWRWKGIVSACLRRSGAWRRPVGLLAQSARPRARLLRRDCAIPRQQSNNIDRLAHGVLQRVRSRSCRRRRSSATAPARSPSNFAR